MTPVVRCAAVVYVPGDDLSSSPSTSPWPDRMFDDCSLTCLSSSIDGSSGGFAIFLTDGSQRCFSGSSDDGGSSIIVSLKTVATTS